MQAKAIARYIRISPRKVRLVVDVIRGKNVRDAEDLLRFVPRAASTPVDKVLKSAKANAVNNHDMIEDRLVRLADLRGRWPDPQAPHPACAWQCQHHQEAHQPHHRYSGGARLMGNKVNPNGFRLGITKGWNSRWYAGKKTYSSLVREDEMIRQLVNKELKAAGIARIEIERAGQQVNVIISAAKPGIVIGKGGESIKRLRGQIERMVTCGHGGGQRRRDPQPQHLSCAVGGPAGSPSRSSAASPSAAP